MSTVPVVPVLQAGTAVQGAQMQQLGAAITWCLSERPVALLQQGIAQSLTNATATALTWDTKVTDRDAGWSSGASTRYTAQTPGVFLPAASVVFAGSATGARAIWFRVTTGTGNPLGSGVTTEFGYTAKPPGSVGGCGTRMLTPYMYVADYIEVLAYQSSGGALSTLVTTPGPPWFSIEHVSG